MGREIDNGCMWVIGTSMRALVQGIGALIGIAGVAAASKPVDVAMRLREVKPQITNKVKVALVRCSQCQTSNEVGQIECYACGHSLITTTQIQVAQDGLSPLLVQWIVLGLILLIGFFMTRAEGGTAMLGCVIVIACVGWLFGLLRITMSR